MTIPSDNFLHLVPYYWHGVRVYVGDWPTFFNSAIATLCFMGIMILLQLTAYLSAKRDRIGSNKSTPSFGLVAPVAFDMALRFVLIAASCNFVLGVTFAVIQSAVEEQTSRNWVSNGYLGLGNLQFFGIVTFILSCLLINSNLPARILRRHLGEKFTGNEHVLFAGCRKGKNLIAVANELQEGSITVCDPWNTLPYPFSCKWAVENIRRAGASLHRIKFFALEDLNSRVEQYCDLRSIPLPNENVDLVVLDSLNFYDDSELDLVSRELFRVLKPGGLLVNFRFLGGLLEEDLVEVGFTREKKFTRFMAPFGCSIVHFKKQNEPSENVLNRPNPLYFQEVQSEVSPVPMKHSLAIALATSLIFSLVLTGVVVFLIWQFWEIVDVPRSLPLSTYARLGAGFLCPNVIWLLWGFIEAVFSMNISCRQGLVTTPKQLVAEYFKLAIGFAIGNSLFQIVMLCPSILIELYLVKYIPNYVGLVNTILIYFLLVVMGIFIAVAARWYAKSQRRKRTGENQPLLDINA